MVQALLATAKSAVGDDSQSFDALKDLLRFVAENPAMVGASVDAYLDHAVCVLRSAPRPRALCWFSSLTLCSLTPGSPTPRRWCGGAFWRSPG